MFYFVIFSIVVFNLISIGFKIGINRKVEQNFYYFILPVFSGVTAVYVALFYYSYTNLAIFILGFQIILFILYNQISLSKYKVNKELLHDSTKFSILSSFMFSYVYLFVVKNIHETVLSQILIIVGILFILSVIRHFISKLFEIEFKYILMAIIVFALLSVNFSIMKEIENIDYEKSYLTQQNYSFIEIEDNIYEEGLNYTEFKEIDVIETESKTNILVVTLLDNDRQDIIATDISVCFLDDFRASCFGSETIDGVRVLGYYHYTIVNDGIRLNANPYFYFNWFFYFGIVLTILPFRKEVEEK